MKKIKSNKEATIYRLNSIAMKEISDKYPDKIIGAKVENGKPVLLLDTCRIKYVTFEIFEGKLWE
tara:strand:- start:402 stop:596 length:195 start_codon:yes stop_codon:yes gene_type:complete